MESSEPPGNLHFNIWPLFLFALAPAFGFAEIIVGFLVLCILLAFSALISGSEVAYFSISPAISSDLVRENSKSANRILKLRQKPRILLATILICNNFINIGIVLLSNYLITNLFPSETFLQWSEYFYDFAPIWAVKTWSTVLEFFITVVFATFILVLFGEITPKIYANFNNVGFARFMSQPLIILSQFFRPLSTILVNGAGRIEKRLTQNTINNTERKDIDKAIELTVSQDQHSDQEVDILKRIVTFGDVSVKQIMRSYVDITALNTELHFDQVLSTVNESGFSRLPVYEEDIDKIVGVLYAKDLLIHLDENEINWHKLIRRQVKYVPEAKKIDELLKEFQLERNHMAIVVDEFGATAGLVTLEDIMEEVIGDIQDEFDDRREVDYQKIDDYTYVFDGKTLLNDLCRVMQIDLYSFDNYKGDADSFAGLVLQILGRMPKRNAELKIGEMLIRVVSVNERRIEKIQISLPKKR